MNISRTDSKFQDLLLKMGFSPDYVASFNVENNAATLIALIEFEASPEGRKDLVWLCNQIGRLFQREPNYAECTDNFRACRAVDDQQTSEYIEAKQDGCCGSADTRFTNPETGRSYWIGFNYGH